VLGQTYSRVEIVVVDDGSTDETPSIAQGFGDRVRVVRQDNLGANAARNHGVRLAGGAYVAFLDADDAWLPEKLARQVAVLEENPEAGAVHCDSLRVDPGGRPLPESNRKPKQSKNNWVFDEFFKHNLSVILTSTVLIRKACFDIVGPLDETGEVVDDHDFFLRLAWHYSIHYIPEPLVRYRVVQRSLSRQDAVRRVEQHKAVIERAIAAHPEHFAGKTTELLDRWQRFSRWAGVLLYYNGHAREARRYLQSALPLGGQVWLYYAASWLPQSLRHLIRRVHSSASTTRR